MDKKIRVILGLCCLLVIGFPLMFWFGSVAGQSSGSVFTIDPRGGYAGAPYMTLSSGAGGMYYLKDNYGAIYLSGADFISLINTWSASTVSNDSSLFITKGTYVYNEGTDRIWIWGKSNLRIYGEGASTILTQSAGVNVVHFFQIQNCYNFVLDSLRIDGDRAEQTGGTAGIAIGGSSSNCKVQNCYFEDMYNFAVQIYSAGSYNWVVNNQISHCTNIAIAVYYDTVTDGFNTISGNHIYHCSFGVGLQRADHNTITDNQIQNDPVLDYNEGLNLDGSSYNVLTGNVITGTGDVGISIHCGTPATGNSWFNTISSNTISFCAFHGIHLTASGTGTIEYNTISDNKCINNCCDLEKNPAITYAGGIFLQGVNTNHNTVVGNMCVDTRGGSAEQHYGIVEEASDYNIFVGNDCQGNTVGQILVSGVNSHNQLSWNGASWVS